ncbi:IQ and AAA domain-containing protein 1 [Pitangus sulphuratus]|nr:IQ and AAA domain-containing protein 1 [Pitangus sulphuratus]
MSQAVWPQAIFFKFHPNATIMSFLLGIPGMFSLPCVSQAVTDPSLPLLPPPGPRTEIGDDRSTELFTVRFLENYTYTKPWYLLLSCQANTVFLSSTSTYCKMWADAQKDLDVLLQKEREEFLQPETNLGKVSKMLAASYIQYLEVFRKLAAAYDHLVHRQKRAAIRPVLDSVMGRILEIKREMVKVDNSECQYLDDILMELNRPLEDIEIPIPKYFIEENLEVLQQREKTLDEILLNAGLQEQKPVEAMALPEAIKLIQVAERARQGRSRAVFMRRIYLEEKRTTKQEEQTGPSPDDAATRIQKVWRGYAQRKKTEKMREEEMIFLGIILPPDLEGTGSFRKRAGTVKALQGDVQERQDEVSFKEKLRETEGAHIKETLQDQISQCFTECRHITGRFPDYPPEKAGGSKAIFSEKTPEQVLEELIAKQEAEKADQKGKNEKEEKEKPKEKKPQKAGKKEEDEGWKMGHSNFLSILEEGSSQFKVFWQNRDNESDFLQDHDPELIKEGEREEVEEEIRVQVCELMEEKLRNLKLHVDGEKAGTQKKGGKAEKAGKASAKKKIPEMERDLTPDRTIDSLYQELAEGGLLIKAQAVNLSDYIGQWQLQERSSITIDFLNLSVVVFSQHWAFPGSQMVHENAPLVKSMLLAGPTGVGKKMLVHAICTETGANLFNLTPSNIAGKYPGKEGLLMMLHMVLKGGDLRHTSPEPEEACELLKAGISSWHGGNDSSYQTRGNTDISICLFKGSVGKELQPSVVWIGDTEKMFSKAAPKGEDEPGPAGTGSTGVGDLPGPAPGKLRISSQLDSERPLTARAPVTRFYTALVTADLGSLEVLTDRYHQDASLVFESSKNELEWQVKSQASHGLSGAQSLDILTKLLRAVVNSIPCQLPQKAALASILFRQQVVKAKFPLQIQHIRDQVTRKVF